MAVDVSVKYNAFPSDFEPLEQKMTTRYGLEYAKAIYAVYIVNYPINDPQRLQYVLNREFAEGKYDPNMYRARLGLTGDTSFLNIDLASINRIPTIIENMVGKMCNKTWKFQCNPSDTISRTKFDEKEAELSADMFLKEKSQESEQLIGRPLVQKGKFIPEDNDEKELFLQMDFKLAEAEAMEMALKWVFDNNNFDKESVPLLYKDIFVDKKTAIYRYYDENKNIKVKRWDHLRLITPYSVYENFPNIPYQALLPTYTIGDLAKMNPKFTDEELYNIAKNHAGNHNNSPWNPLWYFEYAYYYQQYGAVAYLQFQNFNISVINFYFLSPVHDTKAIKTSKSGKLRVENKKSDYKADKTKEKTFGEDTENIEVSTKRKLIRFEGFWIPNSDYIWGYKRSENEDRDPTLGGYSPETELPCKIIMPGMLGMRNKSMVERMIPFEKQLCLAWYKFQQFLIKARPSGMAINQNALLEIVQGQGEGKALPTDWTKLYDQTGNILFTDRDEEGNPLNIPFKELEGGVSAAFEKLMTTMDYCISKMNEVVGYNTAVDASSPDSNALVGVNKQAQAATYDCLRPYYIYITNLIEGSAKRIALMIQDSLRLGNEDFKIALTEAIGKENVETLIEARAIPFSSANISIEIAPDDDEIADINALVQLGIQNGMLTPSDVLRVKQQLKTNVKLAGQLLVFLEKKNSKGKAKEAQANIQNTAQAQQQSAQMASQMKQQELQMEAQFKGQLLQTEYTVKDAFEQKQFERQMQLQQLKNQGSITVAEVSAGGKVNVQDAANRGKIVTQQIADATKIEREHIIHESKILNTAFEQDMQPKEESSEK